MAKPVNETPLDLRKELTGKNILLSGTTGFLGKVVLSMLLDRIPEVGRVFALVRPGRCPDAETRFRDVVLPSPALRPLRDVHGAKLTNFLSQKVVPIAGDFTQPRCGLSDDTLAMLKREGLDIIVNSAGLVDFDPPVDEALGINAYGARHVVSLAHELDAALVHVSTCFVAGKRSGQILEDEPIIDRLPPGNEDKEGDFSCDREIEHLERLVRSAYENAEDDAVRAELRTTAIERMENEGRDPNDPIGLAAEIERQKERWLRARLRDVGMERAQFWGWTNTYTFTKSLGEQVVAQAARDGLNACIVRPSIVESSLSFPFPGWNEGFTTSGPIIMAIRDGLPHCPAGEDLILDVVPCDTVASTIIAASAACLAGRHKMVYQAATGDVNPLSIRQSIELTGLASRARARSKKKNGLANWWNKHNETIPLDYKSFDRWSIPAMGRVAKKARAVVQKVGPDRMGWLRGAAQIVERSTAKFEKLTDRLDKVLDLFLPFIYENRYVFRTDNTRYLFERIEASQRELLPFNNANFVWRDYWVDIHFPGLEQWVFPKLEEKLREKPKEKYVFRDLVELFDATTHAHRHSIALQYIRKSGEEHLTYGELRTLARRVAGFLASNGIEEGDRVILACENRPEWAAAYFGILLSGATAVPVDAMAKVDELVAILKASKAKGAILSPRTGRRLVFEGADPSAITDAGASLWLLNDVVCHTQELDHFRKPAEVASLIYTSGTTGTPKGVVLSHRNFTFEVSRLRGIFPLAQHDHMLSVLPLHHTFEFTAGLLTPLASGSRVTYISTLDGKMLQRALQKGVTGLIGVPALWQLLQRRIEGQLADTSSLAPMVADGIKSLNRFVRTRLGINVGPLTAYPVHKALGGRLKFLVSGGAALDGDVGDFFRSLGFNLTEGYGLTETAPVLTVTAPEEKAIPGCVGRPLHGVKLKIENPNEDGIGEVLCKGPNVMVGYDNNEEANAEAFVDGWFRTGDLGRIDSKGRLHLFGRQKDVIVDDDGRNVYPDELEEIYGHHDNIKEIAVVGLVSEDGRRERVACLIVPEFETLSGKTTQAQEDAHREEVLASIRKHLKRTAEKQPFHKRIKVQHFFEGELPRTATRKVKRPEVQRILERMESAKQKVATVSQAEPATGTLGVARQAIASVAGVDAASVNPHAKLTEDLGFDSLMFVELSAVLEPHARTGLSSNVLASVETVADVAALLRKGGDDAVAAAGPKSGLKPESGTAPSANLPAPVRTAGKSTLRWGQKAFYDMVMDVSIEGARHVPRDQGFLVAANHTSHLDAGLVKTALGEYGKSLVALAAQDYFFGSKLRRTYFENFTNLLPIDRHGSARDALANALRVLQRGQSLLIFPEGTRSKDGQMHEFKSSVAYLALQAGRPILPMYLWGTHEAMPKGGLLWPKQKKIGARIGPPLRVEHMQELMKGRAKGEGYRLVTLAVERAVHIMRDGGTYKPKDLVTRILGEAMHQKAESFVKAPVPQTMEEPSETPSQIAS